MKTYMIDGGHNGGAIMLRSWQRSKHKAWPHQRLQKSAFSGWSSALPAMLRPAPPRLLQGTLLPCLLQVCHLLCPAVSALLLRIVLHHAHICVMLQAAAGDPLAVPAAGLPPTCYALQCRVTLNSMSTPAPLAAAAHALPASLLPLACHMLCATLCCILWCPAKIRSGAQTIVRHVSTTPLNSGTQLMAASRCVVHDCPVV